MTSERFDRSIRFFGQEGQIKISTSHVAVIGIGGLGTHIVQQLALLGIGRLTLVDNEELDLTNLNRYVGVHYDDPIPGTLKVDIGARIAKKVNPQIRVDRIPLSLITNEAFKAIIQADYVFGCVDREGIRLVLNELCAAYSKPYFDLASDIIPGNPVNFGGRVCIAWEGQGCLYCYDELDIAEAQADLLDPAAKRNREGIYGVSRENLSQVGPSVVSINGVISSLAVTEFMLAVTGIRSPQRVLIYHGRRGIVAIKNENPTPDCYYCRGIRGIGDAANVQRYIQSIINL